MRMRSRRSALRPASLSSPAKLRYTPPVANGAMASYDERDQPIAAASTAGSNQLASMLRLYRAWRCGYALSSSATWAIAPPRVRMTINDSGLGP